MDAKRLVAVGCLVVGLVLPLLLPAQGPVAKGKSVALLVGVGDYKHSSLSPLEWSENDVEKLAALLGRPGSPFRGNVRVLTSTRGRKDGAALPTAANVRKAVDEVLNDLTKDDTVLVALSGHGVQLQVDDPEGKKAERSFGFFCPEDAQLRGVDYATGQHPRLLSLGWLMGHLGDCGAGTKLVLMDACRNELKARDRALDVSPDSVPAGVSLFLSCSKGERSYELPALEHGLFFHFVLEGLKGKAANARGEVTWSRLGEFVAEQMSEEEVKRLTGGRKQTPHLIASLKGRSPVLVRAEASVRLPPDGPTKEDVGKVEVSKELVNGIGMKLVRIPGTKEAFKGKGTFLMGSPAEEQGRGEDEGPQHEVEVSGFYLGAYEVTQEEYEKVMGKNPSDFRADGDGKDAVAGLDTKRFPVEGVSSEDAAAFCEALTKLDRKRPAGYEYRLPTEAEWEYACRGPGPKYQPFHFGDKLSAAEANFDGNFPYGGAEKGEYRRRTLEVGSFRPNGWGLYDMHGNVWEWCQDWYTKDSYGKSARKDPRGPSEGSSRVTRGGSWYNNSQDCRSASRHGHGPANRGISLGFRVALVSSVK